MCDLDGHVALGRQEDDVVAVLNRKIQLIDACVVQNGVLAVVDNDIIGIGNLGFLIRAKTGAEALAVCKRAVYKFRVPFGAGRGGDADGGNVMPAVVDQRNGYRHFLLAAAGQQQRTQRSRQRHKKQLPDFFHDSPPDLICEKSSTINGLIPVYRGAILFHRPLRG